MFCVYLVNECCGITYSTKLGWTLRNGGLVRKFDANQPATEPRQVFKTWEVYVFKSETIELADGELFQTESSTTSNWSTLGVQEEGVKAYWGTVSFRKECVGNEKGT